MLRHKTAVVVLQRSDGEVGAVGTRRMNLLVLVLPRLPARKAQRARQRACQSWPFGNGARRLAHAPEKQIACDDMAAYVSVN